MPEEGQPNRRWDDTPGNFEWRLLHLEKENDDKEQRLRGLEGRLDVIETKLDALVTTTSETKDSVNEMKADKFKNLMGFLAMGATIVGTAVAEHYLR